MPNGTCLLVRPAPEGRNEGREGGREGARKGGRKEGRSEGVQAAPTHHDHRAADAAHAEPQDAAPQLGAAMEGETPQDTQRHRSELTRTPLQDTSVTGLEERCPTTETCGRTETQKHEGQE